MLPIPREEKKQQIKMLMGIGATFLQFLRHGHMGSSFFNFCLGTGVPRLCAGFGTSSSSSSSSSASLAYS